MRSTDEEHDRPVRALDVGRDPPRLTGLITTAAVLVLVVVGGFLALGGPSDSESATEVTPPTVQTTAPQATTDASGAVENPSTTPPDVAGAVPGDEGLGPLPLGAVTDLPGDVYLNFFFEFCEPGCYRDAVFAAPGNPREGLVTAERPFHVRHGFINNSDEPLGEGFDVVMYITRWSGTVPTKGPFEFGQTYRFTSDYVLRGTSDQCGPTYRTQTEPETCEWFVHDFPDGLPEGRYDLWAVWEAPCSAWVDLGFTDTCDDPSQIVSLFSSGVNSPFAEAGTITISVQDWSGAEGYRLLAGVWSESGHLVGGAFWTRIDSDPFSGEDVVHPPFWGEDGSDEANDEGWGAGDYLWEETARLVPGSYRIDFWANPGELASYGSHVATGAIRQCSLDVEVRAGEVSTVVISGIPSGALRCPTKQGILSVEVLNLAGFSGSQLAGVLFRSPVPPLDAVAGFAADIDSDPYSGLHVLGMVDEEPGDRSGLWPWAYGEASIPAGEYTLWLFLGRDYCCYSRWVPADTPDLRGCELSVTMAGQAQTIRVSEFPEGEEGSLPTCAID